MNCTVKKKVNFPAWIYSKNNNFSYLRGFFPLKCQVEQIWSLGMITILDNSL